MLIKNAKVFVGKAFVDADIQFDGRITAIGKIEGPADLDAAGGYVIPGLVDIHTHGAMGRTSPTASPPGFSPWRTTTPPTASPAIWPPP